MEERRLIRCLALFSIVVLVGIPIPALADDEPLEVVEETAAEAVEEIDAVEEAVEEVVEEVPDTTAVVAEEPDDVEATTSDVQEGTEEIAEPVETIEAQPAAVTEAVDTDTSEAAPVAVTTQASAPVVSTSSESSSSDSPPSSADMEDESATSSGGIETSTRDGNRSAGTTTTAYRVDAPAEGNQLSDDDAVPARPAPEGSSVYALQPSEGGPAVLQTRQPKDPEELLDSLIDVGQTIEGPAVLGTRIEGDADSPGSQAASEPEAGASALSRTGLSLLPFVVFGLCLIVIGALPVSRVDQRASARLFA